RCRARAARCRARAARSRSRAARSRARAARCARGQASLPPPAMSHSGDLRELALLSATELARRPAALSAIAEHLARPATGDDRALAAALLGKLVRLHRLRPQHVAGGFPAAARLALV